jgi:thioredoxin-like negative regulator of GroEL
MKPDWDKLGAEFADSKTVLIGDVDCTVEKPLCSKYDIKGFPTIKVFNDGSEEAYEGGRDFESLKAFASENLGPSCNSDQKDLCSAEMLKELEELEALGKEEVAKRIQAGEDALEAAGEVFDKALKDLQATYETISKEKDAAVAAAKGPLTMLKKVKFA